MSRTSAALITDLGKERLYARPPRAERARTGELLALHGRLPDLWSWFTNQCCAIGGARNMPAARSEVATLKIASWTCHVPGWHSRRQHPLRSKFADGLSTRQVRQDARRR